MTDTRAEPEVHGDMANNLRALRTAVTAGGIRG